MPPKVAYIRATWGQKTREYDGSNTKNQNFMPDTAYLTSKIKI